MTSYSAAISACEKGKHWELVLELLKEDATEKLADIAVYCGMGARTETSTALTRKLIDQIWALNDEIGIPRTTDVIRTDDIEGLITAALTEGGNYPSPRFITENECRDVLRAISS
jgi:alcohol dehydrogenase class IV